MICCYLPASTAISSEDKKPAAALDFCISLDLVILHWSCANLSLQLIPQIQNSVLQLFICSLLPQAMQNFC